MFVKETGSGVPLVLLHGYCGSHRYWDEAAALLAERYRVITPDLRGHGDSPAADGDYPMESLAEDTLRLLDRLDLARVYLFGHSLGGYVALAFAEQYADRLFGYGLVHSTSYPDTDAARANRDKAVDTIGKEGVEAFVNGLVPKLFAPEHRNEEQYPMRKALEIGYGTSSQGAIGCALGMRDRPDRTSVLRRANMPILLLAGEKDEVITEERRFPVSGPSIAQVTLSGVGHMSMMENPRALTDAITAFVQGTGK
ncbi:alpha/beta fold hydrolase [Cohnella panacarvi]|uniref:alpha/beta fold hydrolase n=1 Tax=Cohnella panacarvi TaxID=400776 RepID=UPI00047938CC|nr:alpha/beta fold hydrolase [Cohnella panacarvi]